MMTLVAVVPTVTTLIVITLLVIWLPRNWKRLEPIVRWGGVAAAVLLLGITTWQAWSILTQPETVTALAWLCWSLQFLVTSAVILQATHALKHSEDDTL